MPTDDLWFVVHSAVIESHWHCNIYRSALSRASKIHTYHIWEFIVFCTWVMGWTVVTIQCNDLNWNTMVAVWQCCGLLTTTADSAKIFFKKILYQIQLTQVQENKILYKYGINISNCGCYSAVTSTHGCNNSGDFRFSLFLLPNSWVMFRLCSFRFCCFSSFFFFFR
jgi:hypothetical protein